MFFSFWASGSSHKGPKSLSVLYPSFQPSFHSSIFPRVLLELCQFFLNFARTHLKLCVTAGFSGNFPKIRKIDQKMGQKHGFLNLLINFYCICSIMKTCIISCVPVKTPYLGKFQFLRYGPKCSQSIRLQNFFINHISRTNQ